MTKTEAWAEACKRWGWGALVTRLEDGRIMVRNEYNRKEVGYGLTYDAAFVAADQVTK